MVLVTSNWRIWLAGMAASLGIFAVIYFTAIQPSESTANQALKSGLQQTQQVLKQAQQRLGSASGQATGAAGQATNPLGSAGAQANVAVGQAQPQLGKAQKLTACVAAAGTDPTKLQACQTRYAN